MKQITVIGSSKEIPTHVREMAEAVGRGIAHQGAILICGGKGGVMEAACKGAKKAGGLTVGIMPYQKYEANPYIDVVIVTEMSDARNVINVKSGDVVVSIAGGTGTLSEIALALKAGKKVVALEPSGGVSKLMAGKAIENQVVLSAHSVEDALRLAFE